MVILVYFIQVINHFFNVHGTKKQEYIIKYSLFTYISCKSHSMFCLGICETSFNRYFSQRVYFSPHITFTNMMDRLFFIIIPHMSCNDFLKLLITGTLMDKRTFLTFFRTGFIKAISFSSGCAIL